MSSLERRNFLKAAGASAFFPWSLAAAQPAFPSGPIEVVISFPPGGPTDTAPRILMEFLRPILKTTMVPVNKTGAGGAIAAEYVHRSTPDGHTLLATSNPSLSVKAAIDKKLPYQIEDFAALGMYATDFGVLAARRELGINTVDELITRAKQKPDELSYASAGQGTVTHISTELFKSNADIQLLHVPHRGSGPAAQAILGGHVSLLSSAYSAAAPLIESGKIVPLITTAPKRLPEMPDVPTVSERGMAEVELNIWMGLFVPATTPAAIVNTLTSAIAQASNDPTLVGLLKRAGLAPSYGDPASTIALLQKERSVVSRLAEKVQFGE
ncbi:MAG TPA: tripartite tricarboxylate transporter substrate binding protein [Xanthobacteraceae bacterium]|jgi:tripartite-type tricarboxylate transporter receptor subunit TctC